MPSRRSLCVFALLLGHSGVSQQALATDNARPSDTFAVGAAMEKVEYFHAQDSVSGETQDGGQDQMFDPVVFLDPATSQSDYISIYAKHGESGLPEEHWSDVLVMPNLGPVDDVLLRVPLDPTIPNSSSYWNRSWWDVQKHYGPELDSSGQAKLDLQRRRLDFSRSHQSNCITVGGGMVPVYEYCVGCDNIAAQHCLWDMRHNVSGNVPPRCRLDFNTLKPQTECCAQYEKYNKYQTIHGKTSALNDALLCLKNIGCQDTMYYMTLERECRFYTCNTVYVNEKKQHVRRKDNERVTWRGTMYTKDPTANKDGTGGRLNYAGDGLLNGCMVDGSLNGASARKKRKYWKKKSGVKYGKKWDKDVLDLARKGRGKWGTFSMPESFGDDVFIEKNVRAVNEKNYGTYDNKYEGKTIYKGPTRGEYLFLNGREVTPWDATMQDDSIMDPDNWDDDIVDEELLWRARHFHAWQKLFLGLPQKVKMSITTEQEEYNVYEMSLGRFAQIPDLDYDTRVVRPPARCDSCTPSARGAASKIPGSGLAIVTAVVSALVLGIAL